MLKPLILCTGLVLLLMSTACTPQKQYDTAITKNLLEHAKPVASGLKITWDCPDESIAYLVETTTGQIVETKRFDNQGLFLFDFNNESDSTILHGIIANKKITPNFVLYLARDKR